MKYGSRNSHPSALVMTLMACLVLLTHTLTLGAQERRQPNLKPPAQQGSETVTTGVIISPDEDYRVGPSDVIDIQVEDAPRLCGSHRISAKGNIVLPFLKRINILNKTTEEIENLIADGLRGRYLKDPQIHVTVLNTYSRMFFIQGSVRRPGTYYIEGKPTLVKLISAAGGLNDNYGSTAYILREIKKEKDEMPEVNNVSANPHASVTPQPAAQTTQTGENKPADAQDANDNADYDLIPVNMGKFLKGQINDVTMTLQPGDIINIPTTDVFFVAGEVYQPGEFALKEGTTLRQAISLAQGTTFQAAPGKGVIFREEQGKKRVEIPVDIGAVMNGKKDDIAILPNDIVIVPNSRWKSVTGAVLRAFSTNSARLPVRY
ncbi:MAG: polysaccharide biosynthesis/export family protein [Acidobacteriota bacterium]